MCRGPLRTLPPFAATETAPLGVSVLLRGLAPVAVRNYAPHQTEYSRERRNDGKPWSVPFLVLCVALTVILWGGGSQSATTRIRIVLAERVERAFREAVERLPLGRPAFRRR